MFNFGDIVGAIGNKLGIPELGISEALGGNNNSAPVLSPGQTAVGSQAAKTVNGVSGTGASTGSTAGSGTTPTQQLSGSSLSGASGSGTSNTNAADLAYLDDQQSTLQRLLASADSTLNNGLTQIGDSYNKEVGRANQSQDSALAGYNTNREDTTRARSAALDQASSNSRGLADSVRRILGLASGANSSAFQVAAPGMIARDASTKRQGVFDTSGKNFRDIDTAQASTTDAFKNYLGDLEEQRKSKESDLRSGVLTQKQSLDNSLAQVARDRASVNGGTYSALRSASAPYQAAANSAQDQLDNLFSQFRTPFDTSKTPTAATPTLADYTVDKTAITPGGGAAGGESPYQSFLKKKFADASA